MYKLLTKLLLIIMNAGTVLVACLEFFNGKFDRVLTFIAIFPILSIPFFLNKIKFKLTDFEVLMYYLFIFLADFFGCILNLYNNVSWYDLLVHFLSGFLTFILGYVVLKKIQGYNKKNKLLNTLFCLGIVALIAILWEIFEFSADSIIHSNLQHNLDTGVVDTMGDLIVATTGGIIASIIFWSGVNTRLTKRKEK